MKKIRIIIFSLISLSLFSCASKDAAQVEDLQKAADLLKAAEEAGLTEEDIANALAAAQAAQNVSEGSISVPADTASDTSTSQEDTNTAQTASDTTQTSDLISSEIDKDLTALIVTNPEPLPEIVEPELITLPPAEETVKVAVAEKEPEVVPEKIEDDILADDKKTEDVKPAEVADITEVTDVEDVADITDENSAEPEKEEPPAKPIVPGRSVTLKKLEYLDITYPGNGWIYMGITDGSKDLTYFGRKVGTENTKFSVQAKIAGSKILHFYKNDSLTNTFIDDYIEVVVLDEKGSNKTHIAAPEYKVPVTVVLEKPEVKVETPEVVEPVETTETKAEAKPAVKSETKTEPKPAVKQEPKTETKPVVKSEPKAEPKPAVKSEPKTEPKPAAKTAPVRESTELEITDDDTIVDVEEIDTAALLKEIKSLLNGKKYKDASDKLVIFMEHATDKRDEGLFYQGQLYEAKSEMQNIQAAINAYTTLTKNYPASKFWDDANKRIIYLKRFYLEGR